MKSFKGTKGDWKIVHFNSSLTGGKSIEIQHGEDGECITDHVYEIEDAKLIAAALDLLEALQNVLKWSAHFPDAMNEDLIKANSAIEKALGS